MFRDELMGLVKTLHGSVCLLSPVSMMHVWRRKAELKSAF